LIFAFSRLVEPEEEYKFITEFAHILVPPHPRLTHKA